MNFSKSSPKPSTSSVTSFTLPHPRPGNKVSTSSVASSIGSASSLALHLDSSGQKSATPGADSKTTPSSVREALARFNTSDASSRFFDGVR